MDIGPLSNGRPVSLPSGKKTDGEKQVTHQPKPTDTVEISDDARRKLAELADAVLRARGAEPTRQAQVGDVRKTEGRGMSESRDTDANRADKIEQARRRIETGFYDRPEVKKEIADRLTDEMET